MFRTVVFVHILCAIGFTIYVNKFWIEYTSSQTVIEVERRRICTLLNGCQTVSDEHVKPYNVCIAATKISCTGSTRCCYDCQHARLLTGNPSGNDGAQMLTISLRDIYLTPPMVTGTGIGVEFLLFIVLLILTQKRRNFKWVRSVSGGLILLITVGNVSLTIYAFVTTVVEIRNLLLCQPAFMVIISWTWVLTICSFDFALDAVPSMSNRQARMKVRAWARGEGEVDGRDYRPPKPIRNITDYLINLAGGLTLLWWIGAPVYMEGVRAGKWKVGSV